MEISADVIFLGSGAILAVIFAWVLAATAIQEIEVWWACRAVKRRVRRRGRA